MRIRRGVVLFAPSILLLAWAGYELFLDPVSSKPSNGGPKWATPIALEGVPNLHKVSDDLYRSAQPTAVGMKNLQALGIKTIVNLRSLHSDRDEIAETDLGYRHITMTAWHPEEKEAREFMRIVSDPNKLPVLVHCKHGADRTGAMCAIYRIAVQGWPKDEAIREMTQGDFGFHEIWRNLPDWVEALDVNDLE